jgi:hypothetical protein
MKKFNSTIELTNEIVRAQHAPDSLELDNEVYTMVSYDEHGVLIVYMNENEDKTLELLTTDRYTANGFDDLSIEALDI